jgi:hypothetical protein
MRRENDQQVRMRAQKRESVSAWRETLSSFFVAHCSSLKIFVFKLYELISNSLTDEKNDLLDEQNEETWQSKE